MRAGGWQVCPPDIHHNNLAASTEYRGGGGRHSSWQTAGWQSRGLAWSVWRPGELEELEEVDGGVEGGGRVLRPPAWRPGQSGWARQYLQWNISVLWEVWRGGSLTTLYLLLLLQSVTWGAGSDNRDTSDLVESQIRNKAKAKTLSSFLVYFNYDINNIIDKY